MFGRARATETCTTCSLYLNSASSLSLSLSLLLPPPYVVSVYDKLAMSIMRGPPGCMNPGIMRFLGRLGFTSVPPSLVKASVRSRLLTLTRRHWFHIRNLYQLIHARAHHDELPTLAPLRLWFASSALVALFEVGENLAEIAIAHGFKLDLEGHLSMCPAFRALLMRKGGLAKVLGRHFADEGSFEAGARLLYTWLDKRLRRVFGDHWCSHTRLRQVVRSLGCNP